MARNKHPIIQPEGLHVLRGLKAIAAYMGVSDRTITYWAKNHGFPISWYPSGKRVLTPTMIDAWLLTRREMVIEARAKAKAEADKVAA